MQSLPQVYASGNTLRSEAHPTEDPQQSQDGLSDSGTQEIRENSALRPLAEKIFECHGFSLTEGNYPSEQNMLIPSAEVVEYARQARAHMERQEALPQPRPTRTLNFSCSAYRPPGSQ